jgi:3-methyl-2-oxobutanoate hydroxymethyltransferase
VAFRIGIGAGPYCDGQPLIITALPGISAGPRPRYAKRYADLRTQISAAVRISAALTGDSTPHDC